MPILPDSRSYLAFSGYVLGKSYVIDILVIIEANRSILRYAMSLLANLIARRRDSDIIMASTGGQRAQMDSSVLPEYLKRIFDSSNPNGISAVLSRCPDISETLHISTEGSLNSQNEAGTGKVSKLYTHTDNISSRIKRLITWR